MKKYGYDKKDLKGLGYIKFLKAVDARNRVIEEEPEEEIVSEYNVNVLAKKLHPEVQYARITAAEQLGGAVRFTLEPDTEKGTAQLAYFRAGQYASFRMKIGNTVTTRAYSICSAPREALGESSCYQIMVKEVADGFTAPWILENWRVGTEVTLSGPLGNYYYQELRDAGHVIAAAGGSGITPFASMAKAIADGTEQFDLTILYGLRNAESIPFRETLEEAARATAGRARGRVRVVYVLSEEQPTGRRGEAGDNEAVDKEAANKETADKETADKEAVEDGCGKEAGAALEYGLISAELIRKYAGDGDFSLFACGPDAMYEYLTAQAAVLGLPKRRVRFERAGIRDITRNPAFSAELRGRTYELKVTVHGEETAGTCSAEESLLCAVERMGICAPSECRSGECGWCHSRLISGEVFIPEEKDSRRMADRTYGWIHPCVTYPMSDVAIEVFPPQ